MRVSYKEAIHNFKLNVDLKGGGPTANVARFLELGRKIGFRNFTEIKTNIGVLERWSTHFQFNKNVDADVANLRFPEPAYLRGTKVVEFKTGTTEVFYRVHGQTNKSRSWMLRKKDIEGLSAQQIKLKFNLPNTPTFVSEVHVPAGTPIATGVVGPNSFGSSKGAIQYEVLVRLDETLYTNTVPLL